MTVDGGFGWSLALDPPLVHGGLQRTRPLAPMIGPTSRKEKLADTAKLVNFSFWWQELTRFQTQLAPLDTLEQILPNLVQNLSLERARIAIDQLHSALEAKSPAM